MGDGIAYVREAEPETFDLILVDSTDPVGPGEVLFSERFYAACERALRPGGLVVLQSESPFAMPELFAALQRRVGTVFGPTWPYLFPMPCYPGGLWSFTLAAKDRARPPLDLERARAIAEGCRYYTPELHPAAFALPRFAQQLL